MEDIIKTERLILTPMNIKDKERYIEIAQNMRKVKEKNPNYFLYVRFDYAVKDLDNAVEELITSAEKVQSPEVAKRFNICLRNGTIIGYIGFLCHPKDEMASDLGIFLDPDYEHRGYAFEAKKSLLAYYFINYDDKIYLTIHPENLPSYHLHTKCGAEKIAHINKSKYGEERDILVITRKKFIEVVFNQKLKSGQSEKQFLRCYLKEAAAKSN